VSLDIWYAHASGCVSLESRVGFDFPDESSKIDPGAGVLAERQRFQAKRMAERTSPTVSKHWLSGERISRVNQPPS
jgi:hypothetical protein